MAEIITRTDAQALIDEQFQMRLFKKLQRNLLF